MQCSQCCTPITTRKYFCCSRERLVCEPCSSKNCSQCNLSRTKIVKKIFDAQVRPSSNQSNRGLSQQKRNCQKCGKIITSDTNNHNNPESKRCIACSQSISLEKRNIVKPQLQVKFLKQNNLFNQPRIYSQIQEKSTQAFFKQEISRLNEIKRERDSQIEFLRKKIFESEERAKVYFQDCSAFMRKNQEYEARLSKDSQEIQKLNQALENMQKNTAKNSSESFHNVKLEENAYLLKEIEKLKSVIKLKTDDYSTLLNKNKLIQVDYQNQKRKYQSAEQESLRKIKNIQEKSFIVFRQNQAQKQKSKENQSKLLLASQQIQRINKVLKETITINSNLIMKQTDHISLKQNQRNLEQRLLRSNNQNNQLKKQVFKVQNIREVVLKKQKEVNQQELQQNTKRMAQYEAKMASYEAKMSQLSHEIERLNYILQGNSEETQIMQIKLNSCLGENQHLNKKNNELRVGQSNNENKYAMAVVQVQRLNCIIRNKLQEINMLINKQKKHDSQNESNKRKIYELNRYIQLQIHGKLSTKSKQNDELKLKLHTLQEKVNQYKKLFSSSYIITQCKVCCNADSNIINHSCSHVAMCLRCYDTYKNKLNDSEFPCPICQTRGKYSQYIKPIFV